MTYLTHLECSLCGDRFPAEAPATLCADCGRPLLARYDLAAVRASWDRDALPQREPTMWRYHEVPPMQDRRLAITLGEGYTPCSTLYG